MLSDPELAALQANNLMEELQQYFTHNLVVLEQGKGHITVRLRGITRGAALKKIVGLLTMEDIKPDFVAVFGDDQEDENMFEAAQLFSPVATIFTTKVGLRPEGDSCARFYASDTEIVADVLEEIAKVSDEEPVQRGMKRSFSRSAIARKQVDVADKQTSNMGMGGFQTKASMVRLSQMNLSAINSPSMSPLIAPRSPVSSYQNRPKMMSIGEEEDDDALMMMAPLEIPKTVADMSEIQTPVNLARNDSVVDVRAQEDRVKENAALEEDTRSMPVVPPQNVGPFSVVSTLGVGVVLGMVLQRVLFGH